MTAKISLRAISLKKYQQIHANIYIVFLWTYMQHSIKEVIVA